MMKIRAVWKIGLIRANDLTWLGLKNHKNPDEECLKNWKIDNRSTSDCMLGPNNGDSKRIMQYWRNILLIKVFKFMVWSSKDFPSNENLNKSYKK